MVEDIDIYEWLLWIFRVERIYTNVTFEWRFSIAVYKHHSDFVRSRRVVSTLVGMTISSEDHVNHRNLFARFMSLLDCAGFNVTKHVVCLSETIVLSREPVDLIDNTWHAFVIGWMRNSDVCSLCAVNDV